MTPSQSAHLHARLSHQGISFTYYVLLSRLEQMPLTMTEIAGLLKFSTAASTGMVDRMQLLGLTDRYRDETGGKDRRIVRVKITDKGQKVLGIVNRSEA